MFITGHENPPGANVTLADNSATGTIRWATSSPTVVGPDAVSPDGSKLFVSGTRAAAAGPFVTQAFAPAAVRCCGHTSKPATRIPSQP